jgi:membrane AbrB-like protein
MNTKSNADKYNYFDFSNDLKCLACTLACAAGTGMLFKLLGAPAPYLLGSMFGVWIASGLVKPLKRYFNIPRWFYITVVLGLGVLVGAMFSPETIDHMLKWVITVSGMLIATIIATFVGYAYLKWQRGYDPALALFCAIPGGQAEVIILSREFVEKDYVVALCHLVRVVFVFCSVPLVLALVVGEGAVGNSNARLAELPGVSELSFAVIGQFIGLALAGYAIARFVHAPVPFLIGPLLLSMGFHLTGMIDIPRINEFVFLAQVTIGGTVGARLGQVRVKVLAGYLRDAIVSVFLVTSVFVCAAYIMASITGMVYLDIMLAFVPGGIYEVTLLSLIFGFDVAFVAIHHGTRMLFILFSLPIVLKFLRALQRESLI